MVFLYAKIFIIVLFLKIFFLLLYKNVKEYDNFSKFVCISSWFTISLIATLIFLDYDKKIETEKYCKRENDNICKNIFNYDTFTYNHRLLSKEQMKSIRDKNILNEEKN